MPNTKKLAEIIAENLIVNLIELTVYLMNYNLPKFLSFIFFFNFILQWKLKDLHRKVS